MSNIKPETTIRNYILDAMRQLRTGKLEDRAEIDFEFQGDIKVSVKLLGANRFQQARAVCNHAELGKWIAYINGTYRVGKPLIQFSAEQMQTF